MRDTVAHLTAAAAAEMAVEDRESSVLDAARCGACVAVLIYHVTMAALIPVTIGRSEAYAAFRGSVALKVGTPRPYPVQGGSGLGTGCATLLGQVSSFYLCEYFISCLGCC